MDVARTEEQTELRRAVRRFLDARSPEAEVRRLMATPEGYDRGVWVQMARELGLQGLLIPDELGGSGSTFVELAIILEEMGRSLLCAPFFSTVVLAVSALLASGDGAAIEDLVPGIARGDVIATVALVEDGGRWDEAGVALVAERSVGGYHLSGIKSHVLDGCTAGLILAPARTAAGVSLFAVDGAAEGLVRTPLPTMDLTRKQARLAFAGTPARLIGHDGHGWAILSSTLDLAAVALAAEQVGGAQKVLDMSVGHARTRVQFGRPIGSFQAVKHLCADMLVAVESARSAAYYAASAAAAHGDDLPAVASLAKAHCSEVYSSVAADAIQVHGGIGFTWDHPAHLYFKRARTSELYLGDPAYHRELLAHRLGL